MATIKYKDSGGLWKTAGTSTSLYTYSYDGTNKIHILTGSGTFGQVEFLTQYVSSTDTITVNGTTVIGIYLGGLIAQTLRPSFYSFVYNGNDLYFQTSAIYNSLDQTSSGFALDARQGKTLNDAITTRGIPSGGTTGQALLKSSATDYATEWGNTQLQYSTMPTAAIGNLGWIVTFTGATDASYTHGHVYECVSSGGGSPTYSWIGLTASNPNLGINCDWRTPVNQRASTGAVTNAYCIDFWIGNGTVTPSAGNYITLTNGTTMIQRMEILPAKLLSAVVTASIEIGGTVQSTTLSFPSTTAGSAVSRALTGATFEVGFVDLGNGVTKTLQGVASRYIPYLKITATAAINVTRVKLELGGLSTLIRDIPRNYAADLAMCQRYYEPTPSRFNPGYYSAANNTSINIATTVPMRDIPTIAVTSYDGIFDRAGNYIILTGLTAVALNACGVLIVPTFVSTPTGGIIMMVNTIYSLDAGLL